MATNPFIGQLQLFPFGFAPKGWLTCQGQLLPINQNQALFSLLGTTYGGDGIRTFALPNLQGRTPVGFNSDIPPGQTGGEESHTLSVAEVPGHLHALQSTSVSGTLSASANNLLGVTSGNATAYGPNNPQTQVNLNPASVTSAGGSAAHENRTPFLAMTWCIAVNGVFPTRN